MRLGASLVDLPMSAEQQNRQNRHNRKAPARAEDDVRTSPPPKVIKRYSNRKLYDTALSKYVTLEEIAQMIKVGEEVAIIDNESKEDLTSVTLTQIIYEEEKRENRMPLGMLRDLIQTGGSTLQEFFDRSVKAPVAEIRESAQKSVEKSAEQIRQSAAQFRDVATRSVTELTESALRLFGREERRAEEFRKSVSTAFDEIEERIRGRVSEVKDALEALDSDEVPGHAERAAALRIGAHAALLTERIQKIGGLIEELEALAEE